MQNFPNFDLIVNHAYVRDKRLFLGAQAFPHAKRICLNAPAATTLAVVRLKKLGSSTVVKGSPRDGQCGFTAGRES